MYSGLRKSLWEGLERNEKLFQTTMKQIYEKYDQVFEDDILVNMIDFTCSSSEGPIPWNYETYTPGEGNHTKGNTPDKEQQQIVIQRFPLGHSIELLEEALNATCSLPMEASDCILSRTFIMGKPKSKDLGPDEKEYFEKSYSPVHVSPSIKRSAGTKTFSKSGQRQSLMSDTSSNISNSTFLLPPLDNTFSIQMITFFISRQNRDGSFDDTRDISYDCQADERRLQHLKETANCDSGDASLANRYPNMVGSFGRLFEIQSKKRAADHIVQYYKQKFWKANKKIPTNRRFYRLSNSRSMHFHPLRKYETNKRDSRYLHALHQSEHLKTSSSLRESANSKKDRCPINADIFVTEQNKRNTPEVGSCMKEQNKHISVRRNINSMFPLMQSSKVKSKMDFEVLDKTFTYQNQFQTDDADPLLDVTSLLSRNPQFPLLHSPIKNTVVLKTSMDSEVSTSCNFFFEQNKEQSCNTDFSYSKKRETLMNIKETETCDANSSFQKNIKWFPKVAGSPPRLSPRKQSDMLKCRIEHNNTSLDKTFNIKEDKQFPDSSFSAFPVLFSPSKNTVRLRSSVESDSCCIKEQQRLPIKYIKQQEITDVNTSFQDLKWFPKMAGTPSKMSPGKNIAFKCKLNPCIPSLDNTFICQKSVAINEVKSFKNEEQDKKPSHTQALIRRNSFSALNLEHSKEKNSTTCFSLNNTTISLDKTITYQEDLKTVKIAAACNREQSRSFSKVDYSLGRRNSFSPLPVVYNVGERKMPDRMIEDNVQPVIGFHPPIQAESSEIVCSLVNSPGSRRWKRQASRNLSFSTFKGQKSADETFIKSIPIITKPSTDKSSLWQNTTTFIPKPSPNFPGW